MPPDYYTYKPEGEPEHNLGFVVHERVEREPVLLPGFVSKDVIIMQMIEANQILRDHVMFYRDELVKQAEDHQRRLHLHELSNKALVAKVKSLTRKPRKKAKKAVARRKK